MPDFNVDQGPEGVYAELPTLQRLVASGWEYVHGPELSPEVPAQERKTWSDVVLVERLRAGIARLNPGLPSDAVTQVVDRLLTSSSPELIQDHKGLHELLLSGVPVSYVDRDGVERSDHAWVVDFDQPERNEFLAVNQFTVIEGAKNRRPDVLLFVNGLPLGQIECKAPGTVDAAEAAVNQVAHYTSTIQPLYRYVEVIGVTDGVAVSRVGTVSTPAEHFAEWKELGSNAHQFDAMLSGVFGPARLLEIVRDFVLFETDGARTWKVMAKYHQVHATNAAVESVAEAMAGDKRGGLVWHTQGAGKSYTMVFFVSKLRRDPRFRNPTVVAITDRTDLDDQLAGTFAGTHLEASTEQAEEISGGPKSLRSLLVVPAGGIVFTTIQKFQPAAGEERMPVVSERENIVVMADEAHRSQYASLAENITVALPNATRIGFTGTPVEKADRSTRNVFGEYVSVYRMRQAQDDRATVPIYYESRQIPIEVADPVQLKLVEDVLEDEEDSARHRLQTAWAKLEKVVGAPNRLNTLAGDLAGHFRKRCAGTPGKGMVVAYSRKVAADITALLQAEFGEDAVACVISAQATDPPELSQHRRNKAELKQLAKDFRDPDHALRLVVVKDMWLTGFDAPCLHTLYIDKPMRDHGLLQAIARVNRVFSGKDGGYVVDYIGIGEDLRASLTAYDDTELDDPVIPAERAVIGMREKYEVLAALLHPAGYRPGESNVKDHELLVACVSHVLETEESSREFLDQQRALTGFYNLSRTQPEAIELRGEIEFFATVAASVRSITAPDSQASPAAEQAIRQFMSEGLAAGEIVDVLNVAANDRPELSILSDEFLDSITTRTDQKNLQIRLLEKLLNDEIRSRGRSNQAQARLFSDQITDVLRRYELRQITGAEVVKALVELAKKLRDAKHRHEQLGLSPEEAAFYDTLAQGEGATADPAIAKIAAELVTTIRNDLTVDWADREQTEAQIQSKIKRLLRRHRWKPPASGGADGASLDDYAQLVLDQAKALYRYWPDVDEPGFG